VGAPWLSIGVIVFSLVLTAALLTLQHRVIKQTGSNAVRADSLHYRSDMLLNGSILIALVLAGWAGIRSMPGSAWALPRTFCGARSRSPGKVCGADG
jgi:divalent metal cation (Fe/Co/Zn/Cd) transporter